MKYQRNPRTNLQIRTIEKKSLRGRKDFLCKYVFLDVCKGLVM